MHPRPSRHRGKSNVRSDLLAIVKLWQLRLLVPLNGQSKFITRHGFENDDLAESLDMSISADDPDENSHSVAACRSELRERYLSAEAAAHTATLPEQVSKNIGRLAELVGLNDADRRILEFAVMLQNEPYLADTADYLGSLTSTKAYQVLSTVLDLPLPGVRTALGSDGVLTASGLLALERSGMHSLRFKLNMLSDSFADHVSSTSTDPIDLLRDTVLPSLPGHLTLDDFEHLEESLRVLRPYFRRALESRRTGVNVLLHGSPGTGKNQLAKAISADLGSALYEVSGEDNDGDPVDGTQRLRAYRAAQSVLSRSRALILFDEVEDVFETSPRDQFFGRSTAKGKKAWINRALESNPLPALWLSNSINDIDPAFLRRFDMIVEVPVPPRRQRQKIAQEVCGGLLDAQGLARLADCETLAPAVVARAAAVVRFVGDDLANVKAGDVLQRLIDQTLQAQGHPGLATSSTHALPETYDPKFIRTDVDLGAVAQGIASAGSARLCLYGPPGTGKTAWARWLATQLNRPLLVKRASDLASMWVGQTEKLIAAAFRNAEAEGAVLLIDEVDSFLQERRGAKHSWEVTQVNEMLTQMEGFGGVFIASTNLMEGLDEASLRRFDMKVRFDFLACSQAWELLVKQVAVLGLPEPSPDLRQRLNRLAHLTPGDFAAIARQHRFRPLACSEDVVRALEIEVSLKRHGATRSIGFA